MVRLAGIRIPGENEIYTFQLPETTIDRQPSYEQELLIKLDQRIAELEAEVEREKAIASRLSGECAKWEKRDDHMAAKVERLREALESVEWSRSSFVYAIASCPWCDNPERDGHAPSCKRQAALAPTGDGDGGQDL